MITYVAFPPSVCPSSPSVVMPPLFRLQQPLRDGAAVPGKVSEEASVPSYILLSIHTAVSATPHHTGTACRRRGCQSQPGSPTSLPLCLDEAAPLLLPAAARRHTHHRRCPPLLLPCFGGPPSPSPTTHRIALLVNRVLLALLHRAITSFTTERAVPIQLSATATSLLSAERNNTQMLLLSLYKPGHYCC